MVFRFCNVVSVRKHTAQIKLFSSSTDVIGFVETRDRAGDADSLFADLRSFNVFRLPRDVHGGGVSLSCRKHLRAYRRTDLETADLEFLVVELSALNLVIGVFYGPPISIRTSLPALFEHFRDMSQDVIKRLIVFGDFNTPDVSWQHQTASSSHGQQLLDACREFDLKQLINFPTRGDNTLDLVFLPCSLPVISVTAISPPAASNDHVGFELKTPLRNFCPKVIKSNRWIFDTSRNDDFQLSLSGTDWDSLLFGLSPNEQAGTLESHIVTCAKKFHRFVSVRNKLGAVHFPQSIRKTIKRRDAAFSKFRSAHGHHKITLQQRWKKISKLADKKIHRFQLSRLMDVATSTRDPQKFWKFIKSTVDVQSVPPLRVNDSLIFSDKEKADALNRFFADCQQDCSSHCHVNSAAAVPPNHPEAITDSEILRALHGINPRKSSGPFQLTYTLLQMCGDSILPALVILFNACLSSGVFPDAWKGSSISPIPRGSGDKTTCASFRPISLLHPLGKLLEAILSCRLRNHLEGLNLLSDEQFGFRAKRSTELLITLTVQSWKDSLADGFDIDIIFLDCQKAFDKADHQNLLASLQNLNVSSDLVSLISDYLRGRTQRTVVDGSRSDEIIIRSGVPQGSILGPLLYICLVNDLSSCVSAGTFNKLFADDSCVYRVIKSPSDEFTLQQDIDSISAWAVQKKLPFNPGKSVHLRLSSRREPEAPAVPYHLNGIPIQQKDSANTLDFTSTEIYPGRLMSRWWCSRPTNDFATSIRYSPDVLNWPASRFSGA